MQVVIALLPVVVALVTLLALRKPVWVAALSGLAVTIVHLAVQELTPNVGDVDLGRAAGSAAVLVAEAAMVIVPGLMLNAALGARGVHERIAGWVKDLPMPTSTKVALVVMGIGPALESLTGFGVSLLVTVPVLMRLNSRPAALRQSLLGMAIVPWGTVGLATVIGAALAGREVQDLGVATALICCAIFPILGAMATSLVAVDGPATRLRAAVPGAASGAALGGSLVLVNAAGLTEVAGIIGGSIVAAGILVPCAVKHTLPRAPWSALWPYLAVLVIIAGVRILVTLHVPLDVAATIGGLRFTPLTSPGIALLAVTIVVSSNGIWSSTMRGCTSAWKPLTALAGFICMAQLMIAVGSIDILADAASAGGTTMAVLVSPILAASSGYLTGSGTSGNALMMPTQRAIGAHAGIADVTTAVQNAGAGAAMLTSLPTTTLVLGIAGNSTAAEERSLAQFSLRVLAVLLAILVTASIMGYLILTGNDPR